GRPSGPEPAVPREDHGLGARPHPELVEDAREVVAHRLLGKRQALPDLRVAQALGDEREHLALAGRERAEGGVFTGWRRFQAHEVEDPLLEALPGRLALEQDVVGRFQLYELRARD